MEGRQKLLFVTGNKNKLEEMQFLLGGHFQLESANIDLPELQGSSFEIAREKCKKAAEIAIYVEDTGLGFNAIKGLPGPYTHGYREDLSSVASCSKWFLDGIGLEGLVKMLEGYEDKSAEAYCTIAYTTGPGSEPIMFFGSVKSYPIWMETLSFTTRNQGSIVNPEGPRKFGWDPIFKPDGQDGTYASMDAAIKNTISHRHNAVVKLREYLEKEQELRKNLCVTKQ
ncbi:hypothetical protein BGZ65_005807 [Modicella reniformis]|uniref:Inosine triphosphate pyrophosphatase n=1 Tax=Modicella reniformis TaxID=1440133 RepID=A0A9P6LU97_9FUNG|nr:hypothetical protein BGZ65_005807 [Modicella reniformis]